MDLQGTQLSHYRLIAKLGEGGMGSVYRAEDVRLGRQVALKLLPPQSAANPNARERFLVEARAVSSLEHPHICMLYEFDDSGDPPFLAMQLVDGETLKEAIARGPLGEARAREVIGAIAAALAAAHARGIVHRDVKSDNILLGKDGSIKLTDFGIARLSIATGLTTTSAIIGTPHYLSPEQFRGEPATVASDQFALGVVAYEAITGVLPFPGDSMHAVMYGILNTVPEPPGRVRPGLGPTWDEAIGRALEKEASARYPSIRDLALALDAGGTAFAPAFASSGAGPVPSIVFESTPAAPAAVVAPVVEAPSLAVLYFENLSSDPESDYFGAGITEDILTDLSRVPGLRVASRNAVARYRGQRVDVKLVGEELGVGSVLEGSIRRAANRVRINPQLVDARTGFHLWAERYDRTLDDVFAVQEDIAHAIATALRGALTPSEAAEIRRTRPAEVEAYDLYLRGRDFYHRYTSDDNRKALESFEKAVAVDPRYALAWAGIADCCAQMNDKGWDIQPAWQDRGYQAARRSIELDAGLAEGHKAEAFIWRTRRDHPRSVEALQRALDANPRFLPALMNLAHEFMFDGDFAGAERCIRRAIDVDPAYGFSHIMLAVVQLYTRRYEGVIESCHRAQNVGMSPFYATYSYMLRAHAYTHAGELAAAQREIQGGRAANVPAPILRAAEALVATRAGDTAVAVRLLGDLDAEPPRESWGCELAAGAAGRIGRTDLTIRFLRAAERIDQRHWASWRINPDLRSVRETPDFEACLAGRGRRMVWPIEAPPLPSEDRAQFSEYGEASGLPSGTVIP